MWSLRAVDQLLDDDRVDDRPSAGDNLERLDQLVAIAEAFLKQVATALRAWLEQTHGKLRVRILAECDEAHRGPFPAQSRGETEAFAIPRRRHADVDKDDVRVLLLYCCPE